MLNVNFVVISIAAVDVFIVWCTTVKGVAVRGLSV